MRCSCKECGTYMVQAESDRLGCVCPECGARCNDCLGTDTVVRREQLASLASDPRFFPENIPRNPLRSKRSHIHCRKPPELSHIYFIINMFRTKQKD